MIRKGIDMFWKDQNVIMNGLDMFRCPDVLRKFSDIFGKGLDMFRKGLDILNKCQVIFRKGLDMVRKYFAYVQERLEYMIRKH